MTARLLVLEGGAPWGFRIQGGVDLGYPLKISRVNPGSKAATSGVREGDLITSINGVTTRDSTNSEAHGLLRNAGATLRLGLNEDSDGSPKRRQFRTIHQETHQETVKRSSITSYSLEKTEQTVQTKRTNESDISNTNENTINRATKTPPSDTVVQTRPTIPSASSTSSSSTSTLKEDLRNISSDNAEASQRSSYTNCTLSPTNSVFSEEGYNIRPRNNRTSLDNMNDTPSNASKSKRRRHRRRNRKQSPRSDTDTDSVEVDSETTIEEEEYIVNSPVELKKTPNKTKKPIKSRSLDDEEVLQIQELTEVSEIDDKDKENQAIISEASESEVEWEETVTLPTLFPSQGTLSTLTLPLDSYSTVQVTLISPEEEKTLRNFLERLHLVNGPEEAAKQIDDLNTIESIKQRKARKRAELEQYFLPFLHNPRHLDVISEEDTDREQASLTKNLKQGTPDLDIPPKVPPRPKRQNRRTLPKAFASPVEQAPAILVDAKLVDSTRISEGFCSTMQAEEATSDVEVVYLDDSSGSNTPEELNNTNISIDVEDNGAVKSDANINDDALSTQKTGNFTEETSTTEQLPGGFETITTTTSTKCNFTVKTNQANKNEVDTNIISELTPPPTPDSISPMNEKVLTSNNEKQIVIPHDSSKDTSQLENNTKISSPEVVPSNQDAVYKRFIENQASVIHTNIISPPPPPIRSSSSSTSSSRGSSLCTAKYIPTTSSLTDMTVLTEETYYRPATLRESCLKFLVTLPFGKEILQELAETSKTLDSYTKSFPQPLSPQIVPNLAQFVSSTKKETNHVPSELSDKKSVEQMKKEDTCFNERNIPITKEWLETTGNTFDKWKQLKGLTEPNPRNWVRSFSEIDILNEKHNLEKTDNIPREVNIPIKREWVSQQYLDTIPIRKDNQDQQTKPREERRASFPTIAQWTELRNTLDRRQALEALSCLKKETIIPIIKEWTKKDTLSTPLYKEWVHNPNKTKEINIPIKLDWNTVENTQKDTKYKEWVPSSTVEDSAAMASKPKEVNIPITKEWVGIPTEADPNLLLCLSPKQKEELEKCNKIPNEAENLLDLHNKFLNRTSHEEFKKTQEENVTITNVTRNSPNALTSNSSRLLTIIREEPNVGTSNEDNKYLYFVEKDPKDGAKLHTNVTNARLKARDLTEWLNLARSKSMSESNLSNVPAIPENNLRDIFNTPPPPKRRVSLPYDLYERQMYYLQEKEREIQKQLQDLEQERRKINSEMSEVDGKNCHLEDFKFSPKGDYAENKKRPVSMPMMPTEFFRQQMYEEYLDKCAAREERQQHKVIKISSSKDLSETSGKEIIHPIKIEKEFMDKVKQKQREGILESSKSLDKEGSVDKETEEGAPILVMNGAELKEAKKLPKHLQEFVQITKQINKDGGIWSPGQKQEIRQSPTKQELTGQTKRQDDPIVPIWTPKSANSSPTPTAERKEFKSVNFQSPVLSRKARTKSENLGSESPSSGSRWKFPDYSSDTGVATTSFEKRLTSSQSSPASGFGDTSPSPRLPRAQNPTSTLLQKAREGHLPRGAAYLEQESQKLFKPKNDRPPIANPGEILYQIKNEYTSEPESGRPRKMTELGPRKFEGIGPVAKDGMPLILRSEVKDQNQSKWYKRMYDTIHKQKPHSDEYVTVRYKQRRAQYPYSSGYLSEPEPGAYDSDFTEYKYQTLDRRRPPMLDTPTNYTSSTMPRNTTNKSLSTDVLRTSLNTYKKHPGRIENYTPGHSSISEKEAREWWDEVMDIFDGHLEQQKRYPQRPKSFINQALKESGYESDSTLVFRRREEAANQQLSPKEQREIYKSIQKGGDVPLHGLRKLAPERPKETELVEFFPISPTLTRIRVHKNITPPKEVVCYPVTVHHQPQNTFSAYKRTAPSSASLPNIPTPPPIPPPSPPRRRSSRNNPTLRLVSTMKVKSEKSSSCKRHETCFTTTSKVNFLRDKITCKLSPTLSKRSSSPKMKVIKKITTSPDIKNRITSTITTSKDSKTSTRRVQSKTNVYNSVNRSKSCDTVRNLGKKIPSNESLHLGKSPTKTFGTEKRKFDLGLQSCRIAKSPDLLSPTEVKKATGTIYKKTNAVLASTKNSKAKELLPIKVGITDKAKSVLKPSVPVSPKLSRKSSPSPSSASDRSRIDSLSSPKLQRKPKEITKVTKTKPREDKSSQKSKKEQINDEIAKKERPSSSRTKKDKVKKCLGKAEGTGILKKLKDIDGVTTSLKDIKRQKEVIQSNHFFQHLFLRDVSPTPSNTSRNSWLIEKTNQLQRRRSSFSEPSIGAMKVYLKHTRPVSDSKFISLDIATMRSRSASPKSVTFDDAADKTLHKRSTSLPPKLIFSQTSRPLSPVIHYKKLHTPPQSPKLSRSPSSRKIMQYKQIQSDKKEGHDYSFYMCPNLNYSNTSLDSLKSEEYQRYFNECLIATKKSDRFKDLNQFYEGIKKVGELEKATNLKPRKKSENEIIDFDRWKEVRTRERAEEELGILYNKIKENEKEKGFLYLPKDVNKYKWKKELDRGLRIKEKSVDDIKEEFENIKRDDSQRENAKRREISSLKDTYKPLWRGNSVANIASNIAERRSQSEGRVKTPKQRLLDQERVFTQGIGSRIWSSLSMEQVNILKDQLAEIYNSTKPPPQDYTVQVLAKDKRMLPTTLSVRRNSDSSTGEQRYRDVTPTKMTYMSENDKKTISQTLSKELLEKIAKQRKKNKTALPLVVGKEILGAVAAADANLKTTLTELPPRPLIKTDVLHQTKTSTSETESGSTDESTKTVINVDPNEDIKKKVEYFEKVKEHEPYTPTIYKAADDVDETGVSQEKPALEPKLFQSKSCQSIKEFYGENDLVKFATIPLSATRKHKFSPRKPELRSSEISPIRSEFSMNTSQDSLPRSRSSSPYLEETKALAKTGEVNRLKNKFEYWEDMYGNITLKRSRSESDLSKVFPVPNIGYVDSLRRKYEYPAYSGRGRSRTRRGGVVSPLFLKAEDRFMPHINIISKIASLYSKQNIKNDKDRQRSMEELADILGCPVGEVEKLRDKFDSSEDISLVGHMYTSSPSIRELKDIAPYLAADWTAHKYPRYEDNTRSLSSPETSLASRDTSLVRKAKTRPKSISPPAKAKPSILKPVQQQHRSTDFSQNSTYDPKRHEPTARYQPSDVARYNNGWSVFSKPSVSFKGVVFRFKNAQSCR